MPELQKETSDELYYIHLKNLPWSACHQDVLKFFKGISIPEGGISIYGKDAFVVVTNNDDSAKALALNGKDIHDTIVLLATSTKRDVFMRKCQCISRKLQFPSPAKRIRPTFVPEGSKDMFNIFNPIEIYISDEGKKVLQQQPNERKPKKIRPTLLKDLRQLQVFERTNMSSGGQCAKKIKLADNWLISHLEIA